MFSFWAGVDATDAHVRAVIVVSPEPLRGVILCLLDGFDDKLVEPFVPEVAIEGAIGSSPMANAVVTFNVGVLLGLDWLGVLDRDEVPLDL